MPRGRKKSHVSHIRMVRSCSEASNISTDSSAPKIKDCRLSESRNNCASAAIANRVGGVISPCSSDDDDDSSDDFDGCVDISPEDLPPPKLYTMAATAPSPTRRSSPSKMKITDYFPPSSPPVLLPEVPLPPSASPPPAKSANGKLPAHSPLPPPEVEADCDQASDRSEGDSGKENEEEPPPPRLELAGGSGGGGRGKDSKSGGVMTRSRAAKKTTATGGATKKPFLRLSNTPDGNKGNGNGGNRNSGQFSTPPPSPTKSPQPPRSPPTPHKIKLLDGAPAMHPPPSPASSALQKLKNISFSPKKKAAAAAQSAASLLAASPDRARRALTAAAASASPERQPVKVKPDAGPKKKPLEANNAVAASPNNRSKLTKAAAAAASSHKVTDYFKVRRSGRRPKKALEKEQLEDYEAHLHATRDDHLDLEVIEFAEKGRGVVATRDYRKGEFVVEYAGDLIDTGMAKERESKYSLDLSTGCYMYYFKHKGKQYCIDATRESGRLGRLVNHSRQHPNLQTKVVTVKGEESKPRLILVAKTEVSEGEELLYDYGDRSKESLKAHPWLAL